MRDISHDPGYRLLKDHLVEATGLVFYAGRDQILTEAIEWRLSALGLRNCSAYTRFLAEGKDDGAEMEVLIAKLTIGETYFFRDPQQFAALREVILPEILERKQSRQLRIWSAGCATGAEPYSLAILLARDFADRLAGWQIDIAASDLNRSYLRQAARGEFRESALRATSDEMKREYFSKEGQIWTIHPRYKQWVSFHHMNLAASEFSTPFGAGVPFDLILCRNVMIYFAPPVNRRLIGHFCESLEDHGWLVVGASEHGLMNHQAFRTVYAPGATVYQKIATSCEPVEAPEPPEAPQSTASGPLAATGSSSRSPGELLPAEMEGLRKLADRGNWQSAAEYGQRLLAQNPLNPVIHFYQALIFESLGVPDEPERSLRQAIYLDRNFALAHYHLGLALKRDRQSDAARCFGNVLKVLAAMPDDATVMAGPGVTVTGLKELAKMHLGDSSEA